MIDDLDLGGAHLLPAADLVGPREPGRARSRTWVRDGVGTDALHDVLVRVRLQG
jgi:uncharacterized protein